MRALRPCAPHPHRCATPPAAGYRRQQNIAECRHSDIAAPVIAAFAPIRGLTKVKKYAAAEHTGQTEGEAQRDVEDLDAVPRAQMIKLTPPQARMLGVDNEQ